METKQITKETEQEETEEDKEEDSDDKTESKVEVVDVEKEFDSEISQIQTAVIEAANLVP